MDSPTATVAVFCVAAVLATAARGEPQFGHVRWQPLPLPVQRVCVGPDGRVWQASPSADPLAKAAALQKAVEEEFRKPSPHVRGATPILFEPGGRVWFAGWGLASTVVSGYDGTTWIHRPLQDGHVPIGRPPNHGRHQGERLNARLGDHLFFVDTRGIDCFDGKTWAYQRLMNPAPPGLAGGDPPVVQLQPDGKGLVALMRSGTTSALWRWRGEWTELVSPGNLAGPALRFAPTADGIWVFSPALGLFFQPFDPAATTAALLERVAAADEKAADRAAAMLATRWQTILPDVQAAVAAATDRAVIERLQRVAAELTNGNRRTVRFGTFTVRGCTNLLSLPDGTIVVAAKAVTTRDGDQARPGVILARPPGTFDALFDPDIFASTEGVIEETVPLVQADGKVWLPGAVRSPARLLDLDAGRVVATMPERSYRRLQAVTPDGTVFASHDSARGMVAFTPGKPDNRPVLLADDTTVLRGAVPINGVAVASDGAIFGVQRGQGFCVFDGRAWKPVAEAAADVRGVVWSATGGDGAVVVKFDRGFGLRIGDAWTFKSDLRPLVEQQRDAIIRCFRRASGAACLVADTSHNIWVLDDGRLTVLVGDRWEDVSLALAAAGRAANGGFQFLGGVGDGSKVYVSDGSTCGLVGEVAAGAPRFARGPVPGDRELMWLGVREPGGALWVPGRAAESAHRLTEACATPVAAVIGRPLLADDDGNVWIASGKSWDLFTTELVVWRDGAIRARVPFTADERGLRLLAAGPGRVLAWTPLGPQMITARDPPDPTGYTVGPVSAVRSRGEPAHAVEPLLARPVAVSGDQLLIVADPDLDGDECRFFRAALPAR